MPSLSLSTLKAPPVATTTDQVFDALYDLIVSFELPPGTKMSEAEVANSMGVSRQPVRDAFFRLSELGFLLIRPQRATLVSKISEEAVMQASFVRTALELACLEEAMKNMSAEGLARLEENLRAQGEAVAAKDRSKFHELDDEFHQTISQIGGRGHVWTLIKEQKAHMDRVRFLSLPFSLDIAFNEHLKVMETIRSGDPVATKKMMKAHLDRIATILPRLRDENAEYFEDLS